MKKEIKNLYPILNLLSEESVKALHKFLEPYIKRDVKDNKHKKRKRGKYRTIRNSKSN